MDQLCATEASDAGLPGTFLAFVATTTEAATDRFDLNGPGWSSSNGAPIVLDPMDLITSGLLETPVIREASGSPTFSTSVWAGGASPSEVGTVEGTCNNYSVTTGNAVTARRDRTVQWWDQLSVSCSSSRRLICFEE